VLLLLGIGFLAGVITAVSPCVFPVLPILFAGAATGGGRRRPLAIIAGLVASFSFFTLFAAWLLDRLHLPQDTLRNISIALLFVLAATLIVPPLAYLLERPFQFLTRVRPGGQTGSGVLLGVSLGLVFVPCGGPVLGAITTQVARLHFGFWTILLVVFYALGAAVPMLAVAYGGQRASGGIRAFRVHQARVRAALGIAIAIAAFALAKGWETSLQTALGNYTQFLQDHTENTHAARDRLGRLTGSTNTPLQKRIAAGGKATLTRAPMQSSLPDYGAAPDFAGISHWLNTPGDRPLSLASLRGKVVLVDFWTYSCINCLRTLPHLEAWNRKYRSKGLVIVGVHSPEFAFEHVLSNVRENARQLGVRYPIALDNDYDTWDAYGNQYWPAEYLIDSRGHVRHTHFGEGEYGQTESAIRSLLMERGVRLPAETKVADTTPTAPITPESYLGYQRLARYAGSPVHEDRFASYRFPGNLGQDELAYSGVWRVGGQRIVAGLGARLRLRFQADSVHLVLGGRGTVQVLVDGKPERTVRVTDDRLYTLVSRPALTDGLLELRFSPGVAGYAFTFG
jgi:cytochrome c biogenesis protein CcdA/thiol-disulfide isomerase/thioredoxin